MDFDPKNCPVGITNEKNLEKIDTKFEMAIQRLEEKLDTLDKNMEKGFSIMNDKFTKLENRLDEMDKNLPAKIDERIEEKRNSSAWGIIKWVLVSIGGSVLVSAIINAIW